MAGKVREFVEGLGTFLLKEIETQGGHADVPVAVGRDGFDKAAAAGILPNRQARAGGAPGIHGFMVGARPAAHPFEEVKDQIFNGVGHGEELNGIPQLAI